MAWSSKACADPPLTQPEKGRPALRYLAVDLGDRRTGLAVGDTVTWLASPAGVVEVPIALSGGNALLEALRRAAEAHGPAALVVGLPINMDGSEGQRAKIVRAFAARLAAATALPVSFQDERLTSAEADWRMARSGLTHGQKKARRDAIAATAFLEDFLSTLRAGSSHPPPGEGPTRSGSPPAG